ncbi:MAG: hypothetical protein U9O94_00905 [Nanoarchaeota archaeon]|nr:hypothetical protein [Nanoarchaeota archaeon]
MRKIITFLFLFALLSNLAYSVDLDDDDNVAFWNVEEASGDFLDTKGNTNKVDITMYNVKNHRSENGGITA